MRFPNSMEIPERKMVPGFKNLCWMDVKIISVLLGSGVVMSAPFVWYALMFHWFG